MTGWRDGERFGSGRLREKTILETEEEPQRRGRGQRGGCGGAREAEGDVEVVEVVSGGREWNASFQEAPRAGCEPWRR